MRHASRRLRLALSVALLWSAAPAAAEEILLRKSCGSLVPPACFTDLAAVLAEIHERPGNGRTAPGPTHPVVVDVGAGVFDLTSTDYPYCSNLSNLSFRGAGKNVSILTGGGYPNDTNGFFDAFGPYVVRIEECSDLDFTDLQIRSKAGVSKSGVRFVGNGGTWWSSVRMKLDHGSGTYPVVWLDSEAFWNDESHSTHHWTDVQTRTAGGGASGFWITGSHHEFRASHIRVESAGGLIYGAIYGSGDFDLSIEGSLLEMVDSGTGNVSLAALWFTDAALGLYPSCSDATASVNGSQIRASSTATSGSISGIVNFCDENPSTWTGKIAARGTEFVLEGASVSRHRIGGNRPIDAPYSLGAGANPPAVAASWSKKGMDTFVETDCGTLCNDTPQGSESHELIFDPACSTAGPWLDAATGLCRGL